MQRDELKDLIARTERGIAAYQTALEKNDADKARLEEMAKEISELDGSVDPDDAAAIQNLATKKLQLQHLEKKFAVERNERLKAANASAGIGDSEIIALFRDWTDELKKSIWRDAGPYLRDRQIVRRFVETSDSVCRIKRCENAIRSNVAPQSLRLLLPILKNVLAGTPPWIFSNNQ